MYKTLFFISIVCVLIGCDDKKMEESIDFVEPQPIGVKNQSSFNHKYQGVYLNPEDSSTLRIEEFSIIHSNINAIAFPMNEIDSSVIVDRTDIKALEAVLSEYYTFKITNLKNDSVYGFMTVIDTIFSISKNNLCRFYKGAYFLNYPFGNNIWKVKRLDLNKNKLTIGMIIPTDSLFNIYPVQNKYIHKNTYVIENDSAVIDSRVVLNYTIVPTKKEFKRLVKNNFFTEWEVWIKQKN
jgi:hypothetical protein